jgi:hypothetical protein
MTEKVFDRYKVEAPSDDAVRNSRFRAQKVEVSGYKGGVVGGDVVFAVFKNSAT